MTEIVELNEAEIEKVSGGFIPGNNGGIGVVWDVDNDTWSWTNFNGGGGSGSYWDARDAVLGGAAGPIKPDGTTRKI